MNRLLPGAAALLVVLVVGACAAPGGPPDPRPSADPGNSGGGGGAIEHPTGADQPVLVVEYVGGFVPVDVMVTQLPNFAMYGDGRVIMQGMQTLEFPGPALPALVERQLSEDGIQAILAAVEATNVFGSSKELRGAMNIVADAPDTVFTVNAGGRTVVVSVYGLGTLMPDMDVPPGMPAGEMEAHQALIALNDQLSMLDGQLPAAAWISDGWVPYEPAAFRLYVRDVTGEPVEGGEGPAQVMEWPTDDDPAEFGEDQPFFGNGTRCGV
ncbi:MAG: hypothetical protein KY392_06475, partial [Chloroflexi bacterium]|nr:hypothetical protein [Chloroflexota bacterium]